MITELDYKGLFTWRCGTQRRWGNPPVHTISHFNVIRWNNPPHVTSPTWGPPPSWKQALNRFHSRGQHLCKFIGTKEIVYIRKEFNSHRIDLEHQYGRRFIVLEHPYGRRDVMWLYVIGALPAQLSVGRFWYDWWVPNFGQIYNLEVTLGMSKALFTLSTRKSEEKFSCYCKISSFLCFVLS